MKGNFPEGEIFPDSTSAKACPPSEPLNQDTKILEEFFLLSANQQDHQLPLPKQCLDWLWLCSVLIRPDAMVK